MIIARRGWRDSEGDRHSEQIGFLRVRNAKDVEWMLRELARQAADRPETLAP